MSELVSRADEKKKCLCVLDLALMSQSRPISTFRSELEELKTRRKRLEMPVVIAREKEFSSNECRTSTFVPAAIVPAKRATGDQFDSSTSLPAYLPALCLCVAEGSVRLSAGTHRTEILQKYSSFVSVD